MAKKKGTLAYVYLLLDPRISDEIKRVRYVGRGMDPSRRRRQHIRLAELGSKRYCHNWIKGLLVAGLRPELQIVGSFALSAAFDEEARIVRLYRKLGANLTNLTDGGIGTLGCRVSDETRQKISNSLKGRYIGRRPTLETCKKISESKIGNKSCVGRVMSAETRKKISMSSKGHKRGLGIRMSDSFRRKTRDRMLKFWSDPINYQKRQAAMNGGKRMKKMKREGVAYAK